MVMTILQAIKWIKYFLTVIDISVYLSFKGNCKYFCKDFQGLCPQYTLSWVKLFFKPYQSRSNTHHRFFFLALYKNSWEACKQGTANMVFAIEHCQSLKANKPLQSRNAAIETHCALTIGPWTSRHQKQTILLLRLLSAKSMTKLFPCS